jgi:hypothetical protein
MKATISSWCLALVLFSYTALGQEQVADTSLLTAEAYLEMVKNHHPLAKQARLAINNANAERLKAGGAFDPKLFNETSQKYFEDQNYFSLQNSGVQIPAWYGLSAKTGYEVNNGVYLNPQNNVPAAGLWYADVSLTLGKGLFIDERRAMLQQARLLQTQAGYDVEWALNKLYQEALEYYWEWYRTYAVWQLYQDGAELANTRLSIVKQNAFIGEEPYIDTLEAYIQYQTRVLRAQKAEVDYTYAARKVETYLWLEGQVPLELAPATFPVYTEEAGKVFLEEDWLEKHPKLQSYALKGDQLAIEQRLNKERLKPQVDLSYKFLNTPVAGADFFSEYSPANYQWGLSASFPLFLRKERGEIALTEVKIQDVDLQRQHEARSLENTVEAIQLELRLTLLQLQETTRMVNNYKALLQAELTKFQNGESSLFLINQREIKYLESSESELVLQAKLHQVQAKLKATAALLTDTPN